MLCKNSGLGKAEESKDVWMNDSWMKGVHALYELKSR